jgi:hypothetical protein
VEILGPFYVAGRETVLCGATTGPKGALESAISADRCGKFLSNDVSNGGKSLSCLNYRELPLTTFPGTSI